MLVSRRLPVGQGALWVRAGNQSTALMRIPRTFVAPKSLERRLYSTGMPASGGPEKKPDFNITLRPDYVLGGLALGGVGWYLASRMAGPPEKEITWREFKNTMLEAGEVQALEVVNKTKVKVTLRPDSDLGRHPATGNKIVYVFTIPSVETFERQMETIQRKLGVRSRDMIPVTFNSERSLGNELVRWAPTLIIAGVLIYMSTGLRGAGGPGGAAGIFSVGKAKVKQINKQTGITTTFADVAGADEAKAEIKEFVQFLKDPKKFTALGARIPKGALLTGPPGTGKTMLAKATAGEASVPFLSVNGSEFLEMFVGVGPARVRDLFKQAQESAPCIVFIDEIDAIGRARGKLNVGGHDERENTLNQMLVEMDGFASSSGVVVMAATNRSDVLDPALLRPGRFDRQIAVDLPDIQGRYEIFKVHLKSLKVSESVEDLAKRLATLTTGFSGADVHNACNEAALIAGRAKKDSVAFTDLAAAIERVIAGLEKKNKVLSTPERTTVAYHEAGHAIAGWFLEHAHPVLKISIVPRGSGALGYVMNMPQDNSIYTRNQILDMMAMTLAGRAAEQLFFQRITTGAADDLDKVTKWAYAQVVSFGMGERTGPVAYEMPAPGETATERPFSDATARLLDEEVKTMVDRSYARVTDLLTEKKALVEAVAQRLLSKENLTRDDMIELVGPRPFVEKTKFEEFIRNTRAEVAAPAAPAAAEPDAAVDAPKELIPPVVQPA